MPGLSRLNIAIAFIVIIAATAYLTLNGSAQQKNTQKDAQNAQNTQAQTEDAWSHRCSGDGAQKRCEIAQRLSVRESGKRVVEMALTRIKPDDADTKITRAILVVPLGISARAGIRLKVDDNDDVYSANISHCLQDGCYAYMQIPDKLLDTMKAGKTARIAMATHQGKQITIPMSLMGFTDAYSRLVQ